MAIFGKILGDDNSRFLKRSFKLVENINSYEENFKKLSSDDLKEKTEDFKKRIKEGETLDDILPEAYALVREAARRVLGQRHYDEQLIGGITLHEGKVAEMKTGEGKTLVATLPLYLNSLLSKGCHIVTPNDYLSRVGGGWMGSVYAALGVSVGVITHNFSGVYDKDFNDSQDHGDERLNHWRPVERKEAYYAEITYGTNNEFGFDYLRDNLISSPEQLVQRKKEDGGWNFVIVDEVDSILIDEARTPLIISQPDEESGKLYQRFAGLIPRLQKEEHYTLDEKLRAVSLTQEGISKIENLLGIKNLYEEGGVKYIHHLEQALKAQVIFSRDKDYVVKDGEVIIVDSFTGRLMPGRRYSEGLHQAIEAKENVMVQRESRTVATVTFQNYFRLYEKLSGMTGTAFTSSEEFFKVYGLEVIKVPTHRSLVRKDLPDKVYRSEKGKFQAVAREIKRITETGQPVLVGTVSIEKNEYISALLNTLGIEHKMLNAKNHEKEAEIISRAGRKGAVTVATNMAGRGVDIILGGGSSGDDDAREVRELGGLYVIGTERHEARRIDDQLRGRAGRQGDVGVSQFFVSVEDDLVRVFGGDKIKQMMVRLNIPEDEPIQSKIVSRAIESAQTRIEGYHFDARKHVLEYDEVINKHREFVYGTRRKLINSASPPKDSPVLDMLLDEAEDIVLGHSSETGIMDTEKIVSAMGLILPANSEYIKKAKKEIEKAEGPEQLQEKLKDIVEEVYTKKEEQLGSESLWQVERIIQLRVMDDAWMDHLEQMDYIKNSVGLRAHGQRDPLVEYTREGHELFKQLQDSIRSRVSDIILKVGVAAPRQQPSSPLHFHGPAKNSPQNPILLNSAPAQVGLSANQANPPAVTSPPAQAGPGHQSKKIGRNDPCHCGSGKKYKKCHGK